MNALGGAELPLKRRPWGEGASRLSHAPRAWPAAPFARACERATPHPLPSSCQRRPGGGRKPDGQTQPGLRHALDALIEPSARASPTNPLRWTCLSTQRLAQVLRRQGFVASASTVRRLLRQMGYSLQANRKTREGKQQPDRDGPCRHIHLRRRLVTAISAQPIPLATTPAHPLFLVYSFQNPTPP
jgi:hypothetical protein